MTNRIPPIRIISSAPRPDLLLSSRGLPVPLSLAHSPSLLAAPWGAPLPRRARDEKKGSNLKLEKKPEKSKNSNIHQGLGYGVVAGASVVKLPQLLKLASAGSAAGLSPLSAELEQAAYGIGAFYGLAHNLPFSAFGETCFLALQNLAILALVYHFNGTPARGAFVAVLAAAAAAAFFGGKISKRQIAAAYEGASLLVIAARVPQIYSNFKSKATGQLSGITYGANALGALARVYTSLSAGESGLAMVRSYALGAALNSVILAQILVYGAGRGKAGGKRRGGAARRKGTSPRQRKGVAPVAAAASPPPPEGKGRAAPAAAAVSARATRRKPASKSKK